jgi:membrane protease YdiL (CAAX protease family)
MIQLIGILAISWGLIWGFERGNLSVLGLMPTTDRLKFFMILFIVSAILSATSFLLRMYIVKEEYALAQSLTTKSILLETWYQFRTVMTEELICRGVILYILIRKIGETKAIVVSSIFFGVLHWMNAGVWGNLVQMSIVFSFTVAMGLLLAYAYVRTYSLLIPFAIHYGWNLTQNYIFPDTATGNHILILAAPPPAVTISYFALFTMLLLPKLLLIVVDFMIVKQHKRIELQE